MPPSLLSTPMVGLTPPEQFLSKFPHMLSGGQRQRILMARAISLEPKLIVADEPVSMIDVSLRLSILNLMNELNEKLGISFVYITHDLATARYIARDGNICVMYLGEIVEYGNVNEVIGFPKHPYTRALISAVPVPDPEVAKREKSIPIKSMEITPLENRPQGCVFYDRCPYADDNCKNKIDNAYVNGVKVKCRKAEDLPEWIN
ncbi:MAG: ABC transporter ATP-binding protein, partial [Clostridia bacterium]|nr:ABC transporter ATP-binding protein [Clostridia bacterium]